MNAGRMRSAGLTTALAAIVLTVALVAPSHAQAGACGSAKTQNPKRKVASRSPLAIGDSVMLLALPDLAREGFKVNARGCRAFDEGVALLRSRRRRGTLPHLSVIALGADHSINAGQIRRALKVIGPKRKLGLVVPLETGGRESNDARVVRNAGRRAPRQVKVLDWPRYSRGHRSWFQPDHLHLTFAGAAAYARLMGKLIPLADGGDKRGSKDKER
ncbi:MAG: hypothetical protein M3O25_02655 [Actinomycetota bacterium]|nr:hypothetical protein [Actinomycetota bacterium]